MLHNNQDPYTVGLIVPNKESIKQLVKERGMDLEDEQTQQRILHLIHEDINHFRRGGKFEGEFPERWLPSAIAVLDNNFNEQNKMMNSTMKIVRNRVYETYKQRIDSLYKSDAKNITHPENIATLKKMSRN
jgi:long-chain acyl-CoA synthetase